MNATEDALPYWILGAGGLLAGEFLRLAAGHPRLVLGGAVTRAGGESLGALHPHLVPPEAAARTCTLTEAAAALRRAPEGAWLVLALPHGEAAAAWRDLEAELGRHAEGLRVVDLSADHRLRSPAAYARWYGREHAAPAALETFTYALPELNGELADATRLAAPGCFATALQLACVPAAEAGLLDDGAHWVLTAVTGSSGSGARPKPGTHHPHRHGNLWGYGRDGHRHEAELAQALAPLGLEPPVIFLPHSGPFVRGIHLEAVLPLAAATDLEHARSIYGARFAGRPFVEVLGDDAPDLRRVVGSNRAAIGLRRRGDALIVTLTLDNLIKGGSGQALQALNLASGWPEDLGLPAGGMGVL